VEVPKEKKKGERKRTGRLRARKWLGGLKSNSLRAKRRELDARKEEKSPVWKGQSLHLRVVPGRGGGGQCGYRTPEKKC